MVLDLLIILATAGLTALVMQRVRLAVAPAYLIAGALIGPNTLRFVQSSESVQAISQLAVILLLFGVGLQLNLPAMRGSLRAMLIAGIGSTALAALVGWPIAMAFGMSAPTALATSMALSISCTAIVLRMLSRARELSTAHGRLSFGIIVIQDLMALGMLALFPVLIDWERSGGPDIAAQRSLLSLLGEAALRILGLAVFIIAARAALPRLLNQSARTKSTDVMMVLAIASAIGSAMLASALGFSAELGAFLAGFLLSSTPFRHQLSGQIGPLRDLFLAVFFTTVGMLFDPVELVRHWWIVGVGVVALLTIKLVVIGLSCWAVGATWAVSLTVGMMLAHGGEFSLVLVGIAREQGLLSSGEATDVIAIIVLSLIASPMLGWVGKRYSGRLKSLPTAPWIHAGQARAFREDDAASDAESPRRRRIIVGGFGPVGRSISQALKNIGTDVTVIELNPETVRAEREGGWDIVFGDAANPDVLEHAGVRDADAVILTMPDVSAVLEACQSIRTLAPEVFITARADFLSRGKLVRAIGANHVVVDELATADAMRNQVMERLRALDGKPTGREDEP